jgi:hypothetical protein
MLKSKESHFSEQNARMPYGESGLETGFSLAWTSLKTPKPVRPTPKAIGKTIMSVFKKEENEGISTPEIEVALLTYKLSLLFGFGVKFYPTTNQPQTTYHLLLTTLNSHSYSYTYLLYHHTTRAHRE